MSTTTLSRTMAARARSFRYGSRQNHAIDLWTSVGEREAMGEAMDRQELTQELQNLGFGSTRSRKIYTSPDPLPTSKHGSSLFHAILAEDGVTVLRPALLSYNATGGVILAQASRELLADFGCPPPGQPLDIHSLRNINRMEEAKEDLFTAIDTGHYICPAQPGGGPVPPRFPPYPPQGPQVLYEQGLRGYPPAPGVQPAQRLHR